MNNELVTKTYLHQELISLENRLIIKLGGMMVIGIGILKFLLHP